MIKIDWSKAPDWAQVVIAGQIGEYFWSPAFGGCQTITGLVSGSTQYASMTGDHSWRIVEERQWNGAGKPPAGTTCEHQIFGCASWTKATVIAYGDKKTFYRDEHGHEWSRLTDEIKFRPYRTPEQIAAEEREKAIAEMVEALGCDPEASKTSEFIRCGILYDAGFRKQVAP